MSPRDEVLQQALALTPEDRAFVVDALEQSLTNSGFATPEIAAAWAMEVERRIAAYERGETKPLDMKGSIERIQQRVAKRRADGAPS